MLNQEDEVAKTIQTYEKTAKDYFNARNDINIIKDLADYFLENIPGHKVLDIGCGPGRDARYFLEHGLEVTGIDMTANFIKLAVTNAPKANFKKMDMRNLGFADESFDGIWSCASFLHIPKKQAKNTLQGFHRVLRPQGLLYISVKQGNGEKNVVNKRYKDGRSKFFAFYSKDELKKLLLSCDFKIIKISTNIFEETLDQWVNIFATKS